MTDIDRFFAAILGKDKWNESRCRICGWPLKKTIDEGCTIDSCSLRPPPIKRADDISDWSPSLNGEVSQEVRKWFAEHEANIWDDHLLSVVKEKTRILPIDRDGLEIEILNAQLSIQNFYDYLVQHFEEWGYEECPNYQGRIVGCEYSSSGCEKCIEHDGRICKYPEAEKAIKEGE